MSQTGGRHPDQGDLAWYARPEGWRAWRIAACAAHGKELERHRFRPLDAHSDAAGMPLRPPAGCAICRTPELLREVERCSCETDPSRCPEHQNLGCGG